MSVKTPGASNGVVELGQIGMERYAQSTSGKRSEIAEGRPDRQIGEGDVGAHAMVFAFALSPGRTW